jgi:Coatomer beta C-terminal region
MWPTLSLLPCIHYSLHRMTTNNNNNNRQLRAVGLAGPEVDIYDGDDLTKATGLDNDTDQSRKGRVYQLTGFADPVYAEAYVTVHDYDIVLEVCERNYIIYMCHVNSQSRCCFDMHTHTVITNRLSCCRLFAMPYVNTWHLLQCLTDTTSESYTSDID